MPGTLKQCPHCETWLKVRSEETFQLHAVRCLWRKRQWYLSVVAIVISLTALGVALAR